MTDEEYLRILKKKMNFRGIRVLIVFLLYLPLMRGTVYLSNLMGFKNNNFFPAVAIAYMIFWLYCILSYKFMKCPKCENYYYWGIYRKPISQIFNLKLLMGRKCSSCGFELKKSKS